MITFEKKNIRVTFLQIIGTVAILMFVPNTLLQLLVLLVFWKVTFGKMTVREYLVFLIASVAMTISQVTTPLGHLFYFTTTDFFTIPWYEIVMWGFYTLSAFRLFGGHRTFSPSSLLCWGLLAGTFLMFNSTHFMLICASGVVLAIILLFAHQRLDLLYAGYFFTLTFIIETTGFLAGLWVYPDVTSAAHIFGIMPLWAFSFWIGTAIVLGRIVMPVTHMLTKLKVGKN